ncbi:hypothetical protein PLICRDRAFT_695284 [Plicaturopsis crispa FD-325 SS-3]|nr:hypothetical protein PLICRDRAFT_695284 [Plicaturopsis crispa FD-325 SS-3]
MLMQARGAQSFRFHARKLPVLLELHVVPILTTLLRTECQSECKTVHMRGRSTVTRATTPSHVEDRSFAYTIHGEQVVQSASDFVRIEAEFSSPAVVLFVLSSSPCLGCSLTVYCSDLCPAPPQVPPPPSPPAPHSLPSMRPSSH